MTLQIRRGGTPFVLGDPIVEPVPAAGALLNVHIRAVLEILAELKRARPAQAKSVAGDLAAAERLLHSPLVADFAHGYSKPSSAPQQQAQQSAADKLRGQVLEARGGDHKRLGAWKDDEYAVSPYFESLTEQRNVLANAAVTEKLAAEIDERAGLLKSGARLAQEERRSASIVIASAQGAVDSFLRETVVPLVINSIRDAHSSIASPTRSPKASPKRMKTRAAVSRRFSNKGALTKPLEGEDNLGYFQEELPMLIADQVNLWWSSVRERMQTLLLEASQMFSEVSWRLVVIAQNLQFHLCRPPNVRCGFRARMVLTTWTFRKLLKRWYSLAKPSQHRMEKVPSCAPKIGQLLYSTTRWSL